MTINISKQTSYNTWPSDLPTFQMDSYQYDINTVTTFIPFEAGNHRQITHRNTEKGITTISGKITFVRSELVRIQHFFADNAGLWFKMDVTDYDGICEPGSVRIVSDIQYSPVGSEYWSASFTIQHKHDLSGEAKDMDTWIISDRVHAITGDRPPGHTWYISDMKSPTYYKNQDEVIAGTPEFPAALTVR